MTMKKLLVPLTLALCCAPLVGCAISQKTYTYDDADRYTMGGAVLTDGVRCADIDWISGDVTILYHDKDTVEFSETADRALNDSNTMYYRLENGVLYIRFARSGKPDIAHLSKALTVYLPQGLTLNDLTVSAASATIHANGISTETITFSTASGAVDIANITATDDSHFSTAYGTIRAENCRLSQTTKFHSASGAIYAVLTADMEEASFHSASGKIDVSLPSVGLLNVNSASGALTIHADAAEIVSIGSVSGKVDLTLQQGSGKISTTSGKVTLRMPKTPGYTADTGSISGRVSCNTEAHVSGKRYIIGEGENLFQISTVSGKIALETTD